MKADFRAAAVLDRFGIDFCCGGRRTLADACRERDVPPTEVLAEVLRACAQPDSEAVRFAEWEAEALIAYIQANHHAYVRRALPAMNKHIAKLVSAHGTRHPELAEVGRIFVRVSAEMISHMAKEEAILFPFIIEMADAARRRDAPPQAPFGSIEHPLLMMEHEHESAGAALARIRAITNGYAPPDDACIRYRVCFQELDAFERDLHAHVHLENNVLFPRARILATELGLR